MNDIVYRLNGQKLTVEEIVEIYAILDRECSRIIKEKREKREYEAKVEKLENMVVDLIKALDRQYKH